MSDLVYTETTGTTAHIAGERGTVVGFTRATGIKTGAFVRMHTREAMLYVTLGNPSGDGGQFHEVLSHREISREEFDALSGLADARRAMGWDLRASPNTREEAEIG